VTADDSAKEMSKILKNREISTNGKFLVLLPGLIADELLQLEELFYAAWLNGKKTPLP